MLATLGSVGKCRPNVDHYWQLFAILPSIFQLLATVAGGDREQMQRRLPALVLQTVGSIEDCCDCWQVCPLLGSATNYWQVGATCSDDE